MRNVRLRDVVDINPEGLGVDLKSDAPFRYIDLSALSRGAVDWNNLEIFRSSTAPSRAQRRVRPGDCLFGTVRPAQQSHGFVDRDRGAFVASTGFAVLRAKAGLAEPRFIYHWMLSAGTLRQAERVAVGSNYPAVNESDVADFIVRLPSISQQRRIAEILDALDARIEGTKRVIDKHRSVLSGLAQEAVRGNMFDAPVGGWPLATINELLDRDSESLVQTGPFGSQLHAHEYVNEGIPVVMPQDIVGHTVSTKNIARISEHKARELARHKVRAGDILFSRRGDLSRCACITAAQRGWLCGTGCLLLRVSGKVVMPEWLAMAYRDDVCQRQVRAMAVGTTMVNLNTGILQALRVPVPPIEVQQRVMRTLDEQQAVIDWNAAELKSLEVLKQGLAEDLLTGRVRVPEAEAVVESL